MSEIKQLLDERKRVLLKYEEEAEKRLEGAPEGALRISHCRGRIRYYLRTNPTDRRGKYIPQSQKELAIKLSQKEYDKALRKVVRQELEAIEAFLRGLPKYKAEEIYPGLNQMRKELITIAVETNEMFAERWQKMSYKGKQIEDSQQGLLTDKGENVRSKSEMIIANILCKEGIPYHYECPIELKGMGVIYPDFTVLNVRLRKVFYWEHQGMMDDENYAAKAIRREAAYQRNGFFPGDKLILTSETRKCPIDVNQIRGIISHYLL